MAALLPPGLNPIVPPMGAPTLFSTVGSSAGTTTNILTRPVFGSASFYPRSALSQATGRFCPYIFVDKTRRWLAVGRRAIRSVSARFFSPGILLRRGRRSHPRSEIEVRWIPYIRRTETCRGGCYSERAGNRHVSVEAEPGH